MPETGVDWPKHGFTHVDAPCHMIHGGRTLDDCDLNQLCGEAAVVDVSDLVPSGASMLTSLSNAVTTSRQGDLLILRSNLARGAPEHHWRLLAESRHMSMRTVRGGLSSAVAGRW